MSNWTGTLNDAEKIDDPAKWSDEERRRCHATLARRAGTTLDGCADVAAMLGLTAQAVWGGNPSRGRKRKRLS